MNGRSTGWLFIIFLIYTNPLSLKLLFPEFHPSCPNFTILEALMKKVIVLGFILLTFFGISALSQSVTVKDGNYRIVLRMDGDIIKNNNYKIIGRIDGTVLKDGNYRIIARIDGDLIKDQNYQTIGRIDGNTIKNSEYRIVGRIDGDVIKDSNYKIIARIDGSPRMTQLIAMLYFLIL
jgi:hypothetical protein